MTTLTHVRNPYSGQSTLLTQDEYKLYIEIKTAEMDEHYDVMQKGLDWFQKYFTDQYYTLLD